MNVVVIRIVVREVDRMVLKSVLKDLVGLGEVAEGGLLGSMLEFHHVSMELYLMTGMIR